MIKVLFFGPLRDIVGTAEERRELPSPATLGGVFHAYAERFPRLGELQRSIVLARNREFCDAVAPLVDGDEIAFLPPVSGGAGGLRQEITESGGNFFALTRDPIDSRPLVSRTRQDVDGAVVMFECLVRNNNAGRFVCCLEYECDESSAIRSLTQLGVDIARRHAITRLAMVHRLGRVPVGEASVVVVVAAAHRKPAFAAAMEAMDRLKNEVGIAKKEHFAETAEPVAQNVETA